MFSQGRLRSRSAASAPRSLAAAVLIPNIDSKRQSRPLPHPSSGARRLGRPAAHGVEGDEALTPPEADRNLFRHLTCHGHTCSFARKTERLPPHLVASPTWSWGGHASTMGLVRDIRAPRTSRWGTGISARLAKEPLSARSGCSPRRRSDGPGYAGGHVDAPQPVGQGPVGYLVGGQGALGTITSAPPTSAPYRRAGPSA